MTVDYQQAFDAYADAASKLIDASFEEVARIVREQFPDACILVVETDWSDTASGVLRTNPATVLDVNRLPLTASEIEPEWDDLVDGELFDVLSTLADLYGEALCDITEFDLVDPGPVLTAAQS